MKEIVYSLRLSKEEMEWLRIEADGKFTSINSIIRQLVKVAMEGQNSSAIPEVPEVPEVKEVKEVQVKNNEDVIIQKRDSSGKFQKRSK